jgi:OOP family OmpA-OmpF porin
MTTKSHPKRHPFRASSACAGLLALSLLTMSPAGAKSLYLIADINASPTPIRTYDIQPAPAQVVYQATQTIPSQAGGAVGLAIDTDSKKLFTTYEGSNTIQLVDATNFANLGTTTAPGASNLAGIVVDQRKHKVYAVDRTTNHLYVYSWVSDTNTLTLDGGAYIALPNISSAYGLALDEAAGLLYVGDATSATVRYFNTTGWAEAGNFTPTSTTQTVMGIAIDTKRHAVYMGNAYGPYGSLGQLVKYDQATQTTTVYALPGAGSGDNIVGVAVDEDTGNVYATTGNQGSGGTDTLIVLDQSLHVLKNDLADMGSPTGIAIPRASISYNPFSFSNTTPGVTTVTRGSNLSYQLCYDNLANEAGMSGVTITDVIPSGTTFVSATGPFAVANGKVTWTIGSVAGGAPLVCYALTVKVQAQETAQIVNAATISGTIGGNTIPVSQVATNDVDTSAEPESVSQDVQVKGQGGGGGSAGLLEVIMGGGAMAIAFVRRRRALTARQALGLALVASASAGTSASAQASEPGWYVGAGAGQMRARASSADIERDLGALGYTAQASLDNKDTGGKLFAGYRFTPFVALEASYVDLGKTTSTVHTATANQQQLVDDVSRIHPISVTGLSLAGVVLYPMGPFSVFGKLGLLNWTAKAQGEVSPSGTPYQMHQFTGTDVTFGLGAGYEIPGTRLALRCEWERFTTPRNDPDFFSLSVVYRF